MRLQAILAGALAASTIAGSATAGSAWGGQAVRKAANAPVLVCVKAGNKQIVLRNKKLTPGMIRPMTAKEAAKLARSHKAVLLNGASTAVWRGRVACLIGENNVPVPDPNETPKPDTGGNTGGGTGGGDTGGEHGGPGDDDDDDDDNGHGNDDDDDDDDAPPPPPPPAEDVG